MKKITLLFASVLILVTIVGCEQTSITTTTDETSTSKVFEEEGFSFTYPAAKYIADDKGLWTEEGYDLHVNPPNACDICQIPEVGFNVVTTTQTVDEQIIIDYQLPGKTLEEMKAQTEIPFEIITIGDNDFTKILVSDMLDVTGYYTKNNNQIVIFKVYSNEKDTQELKDIISTLKFK